MRYRAVLTSRNVLLACSLVFPLIMNCLPSVSAGSSGVMAQSGQPGETRERGSAKGQSAEGTQTGDAGRAADRQAAEPLKLTIDNIMKGATLVGYEPRAIRWSPDSQQIYFEWKQATAPPEKDFDTYVISRSGTGLRKLSEDEADAAPPAGGESTTDRSMTVLARRGDIWVYDNTRSEMRRITNTSDVESNPHFTQDGHSVYFTRSNNLYLISLGGGALAELTDIRSAGSAPEPTGGGRGAGATGPVSAAQQSGQERQLTDSQQYMKKEEEELFDAVKERSQRRKDEEALQKRRNPRKPLTLRANQTIASLQLSPDQKYVIAQVIEAGTGSRNTAVPEYVTESGYTESIPGRTNVGDVQPKNRLAIIDANSGEVKWLDHGLKAAPSPARPPSEKTEAKPQAAEPRSGPNAEGTGSNPTEDGSTAGSKQDETRGGDRTSKPAQPAERDVRLSEPVWSDDGSKAVLLGRAADNKDRWIFAMDPATGKARIIATDHDDAWVDGPGSQTLGWMPDGQHIYFQSERDGFSHLYAAEYSTGETRQLTSGKWEVAGVQLSHDKSRFYLTTSEASLAERHLYEVPTSGGQRVRITSSPGNHQAVLSPDEKWLAVVYSSSNRPPELYVQENKPGETSRQLTMSPSKEFFTYNWIDPPIVSFAARDGAKVYARLYKPAGFKKGGPAVIFVHGAGYLQNVHRWWAAGYYREYMFHHFLMEHGYMVLDCDYRGSAGYGRDWRTGIYRHMGGKDLDDQVDAARWLATEHGVDPNRIGIYGGSYGGFITLMAMFTRPGVFAAGAALRPVTDWADYNHQYTANILNVPQSDSEAYKLSSPIFYANGLKGALLICHGMADTNVHFQDTVRLVQKLIELRKENWALAVYPVENHGFTQPSSWADEYKRIFKLFEDNLKPGPSVRR